MAPITPEKLDSHLQEIRDEFIAAATAHEPMTSHHEAYGVIREEFEVEYFAGEVCRNPDKRNGVRLIGGELELSRITHKANLKAELIQTAAMCLRALHDLC